MRKGISAVMASVLIVLVSVALAGTFLTFTQRTGTQLFESSEEQQQNVQQKLDVRFAIEGISDNQIFLRNTGSVDIIDGSVDIFVNDIPVDYSIDDPISPGEVGAADIDEPWLPDEGQAIVKVSGTATSDSASASVTSLVTPVVKIDFDEGIGVYANDSSGNSNNVLLTASGAPNMLVNPSFEGGMTFYAIVDGNVNGMPEIVDNMSFHGARSAHFPRVTRGWATINSANIPVTPGKTYRLSAYAKAENVVPGSLGHHKLYLAGRWVAANGTNICCPDMSLSQGTFDWTRFTTAITAPSDAVAWRIAAMGLHNATGEGWVDAIQLEGAGPATDFDDSVWTSGVNGAAAAEFDGTNDYGTIVNSPSVQDITDSSFTFEAYAKMNGVPPTTNNATLAYGIVMRPGNHVGFRYYYTQIFLAEIWNSSATTQLSSGVLPPGEWHHLLMSVNDTGKTLRFFVDGVEVGGSPKTYYGSLREYGTVPYYVGAATVTGSSYTWFANATIDKVRIYNGSYVPSDLYEIGPA